MADSIELSNSFKPLRFIRKEYKKITLTINKKNMKTNNDWLKYYKDPVRYISFYVNDKNVLAMVPTKEKTEDSFNFDNSGKACIIKDMDAVASIKSILGDEDNRYKYKIDGKYDNKYNAIVFDLNDAVKEEIKPRGRYATKLKKMELEQELED